MTKRASSIRVDHCPDGHVVFILSDRAGNEIAQAHLPSELGRSLINDVERELATIAEHGHGEVAGHA